MIAENTLDVLGVACIQELDEALWMGLTATEFAEVNTIPVLDGIKLCENFCVTMVELRYELV